MTCDVAVIGGGLAGCMAATAAARAGADTVLIHHAPGATAMNSGVLHLARDPQRPHRLCAGEHTDLETTIERISTVQPYHPYAVIPDAGNVLREAVEFFVCGLKKAGLEISGGPDGWLLIGNSMGTVAHAQLCLGSMAHGEFSGMNGARILVAAPTGLEGFHAPAAARSLKMLAASAYPDAVSSCFSETVSIPGGEGPNLSPFYAAELLDRAEVFEEFSDNLEKLTQASRPTHIAFPAVLGMAGADEKISKLQERLGAECFELAAPPPGVPGARIQRALETMAADAGVKVVAARARSFKSGGGRVESVAARTQHGGETEIRAGAYIAATGKFIAGGLERDGAMKETLFDLPVFLNDRPVRDVFMYDLVTPEIAEPQPLFSCGVRTDETLRALNARGRVLFSNLFCAGSLLGGYDALRHGCGAGVAMATGLFVAKNAGAADSGS